LFIYHIFGDVAEHVSVGICIICLASTKKNINLILDAQLSCWL